jgi:hypothetical protein
MIWSHDATSFDTSMVHHVVVTQGFSSHQTSRNVSSSFESFEASNWENLQNCLLEAGLPCEVLRP